MINDNILALINKTPDTILLQVAGRIKERRLEKNWTQKFVASKAGIPLVWCSRQYAHRVRLESWDESF